MKCFKKIILFSVVGLVILTGIYTINEISQSDSKRNLKFVGSDYMKSIKMPIPSIDWLIERSDLIIIGRVVDDGDYLQYGVENSGDKDVPANLLFDKTKNTVLIETILYGEESKSEILFSQLGQPESDYWQTKFKKGDKVILFLRNVDGNLYASVALEEGCFKIIDGEILYSLSNDEVVANYDGKQATVLIEHIENIINKK